MFDSLIPPLINVAIIKQKRYRSKRSKKKELISSNHGRTQPKIAGGGSPRFRTEGHSADDDLASEKGHLLAKRALFSTIAAPPPPPTRLGTALLIQQGKITSRDSLGNPA